MKVWIAADHAGFPLKEQLKTHAKELGIEFVDLGTHSLESVDYPDYAYTLTHELLKASPDSLGVLLCGSGVGVSIAANRSPQIRAALAESPLVAQLARQHNHANVLCLGARIVSPEVALQILKIFLTTQPDLGERHLKRIKKLYEPK